MRFLMLALLLTASAAHAQAYKCVVDGRTTYQAAPCTNAPGRAVDTSPSSSGVTGLKQDADRMAAKEAKATQQAARARKAKPPARDRDWYRRNCTERRIGGLTASYDC